MPETASIIYPPSQDLVPGRIRRAWEKFIVTPGNLPSDQEVRPFITERWRKSQESGVNPRLDRAPTVMNSEEIEKFLCTEDLGIAGRAVVEDFVRVVEGTGSFVVVSDVKGRIFYQAGHQGYVKGLENINFQPGGSWAENAVGTNGVGTPLEVGSAAVIFGPEHFCESFHRWTCYGSPVFDPVTSRIIGCIDITTPAEDVSLLIADFSVSLARSIERMLGAFGIRRRQALMEGYLEAQRRWPTEGLIVVDQGLRIVEVNRCAAETLGAEVDLIHGLVIDSTLPEARNLKQRSEEVGSPVEAVLEGRTKPFHVRCSPVLVEGRVAGTLFVVSPLDSFRSTPVSAQRARRPEASPSAETLHAFPDILGVSPVFLKAVRLAHIASSTAKTVLLTGETGSGKELFAHAMHTAGPRGRGRFVVVNCAALPHELVESELFGYAPGAFTGARRQGSIGKFQLANGGTIFLDEISAMPLDTQSKLLRVIETKCVERLNSSSSLRVDIRVIAASNDDLRNLCREGKFRLDLFYRLNVLPIHLPSLRDRPEDIVMLAQTFLASECLAKERPPIAVPQAVTDCLERYDWPGNVRELKNLCERWAEVVEDSSLTLDDLPDEIRLHAVPQARTVVPSGSEEDEIALIRSTLSDSGNNVSETARRLGISRTTIYKKVVWPGTRGS